MKMAYLLCVFGTVVLIAVVNLLIRPPFSFYGLQIGWLSVILAVLLSVVAVIAVDGVFALIIRRLLPKKWFGKDRKFFLVSKRECRFYEKIGIKKWKDHILELGCFTAFSKSKLSDPKNNEYIERFLLESNYGLVIHLVCSVVGFSIIFLFPLAFALNFGVPVAAANVILNLISAAILRYNTPKLQTLYRYNERTARLQKEAAATETENP